MFLEILVTIALGIFSGIITGLIPGVHVNLIASLSFSPIFLIAMAITHTFLDAIPAIFLGAPSSDNALMALPGHQMLLEGRGVEAVFLTVMGGIGAMLVCLILSPIIIIGIKYLYPIISDYLGVILICFSLFFVFRSKKKVSALLVFLLSGCLGLIALSSIHEPMFPMLTGLFGISILIRSSKANIPPQKTKFSTKIPFSAILAASFGGLLTGVFPGIGASQAAIIGSTMLKDNAKHKFLVMVGGANTVNFFVSLLTLYAINKARNGAVVAVQNSLGQITLKHLILFIAVSCFAAGIAAILAIVIAKHFARVIHKINYRYIASLVILFLVIITPFISGFPGLILLGTATTIGLLPGSLKVPKSLCMGCILLPVIFYVL